MFKFASIENVEEFCMNCPKTWGIINSVYQDKADGSVYLILEKGIKKAISDVIGVDEMHPIIKKIQNEYLKIR